MSEKQRININILIEKNTHICERLQTYWWKKVYTWTKVFKEFRESLETVPHFGHPTTSTTKEICLTILELLV